MALFKKLNEQIELNSVKNRPISESEKESVEKKIIFESFVSNITNNLNVSSIHIEK